MRPTRPDRYNAKMVYNVIKLQSSLQVKMSHVLVTLYFRQTFDEQLRTQTLAIRVFVMINKFLSDVYFNKRLSDIDLKSPDVSIQFNK